jgi:hypothetical protein
MPTIKTTHPKISPPEAESTLKTPLALSTDRQREVFLFLCQNDGADSDFRVHPRNAFVRYEDLAPALQAAQRLGFCKDLKPYHFPRIKSLWLQQKWLDEIICKKIDTLRAKEYDGSLLNLCANVQARTLLEPLVETINGREYTISVQQPLGTVYGASPYRIVMRYLEATGKTAQYEALRPYHFSSASQGTYHNEEAALEVVCKKIDSLLKGPYKDNFAKLCACVIQTEFMSPFIDRVAKQDMLVKMGAAAHAFEDSLYGMLMAYINARGLEKKFSAFKPYHMSTASQATYSNGEYVDEVIVKSCKFQIATTFEGSESAFLKHGTLPQISSPFYERIAGEDFRVCADSAVKIFGESSKRIKELFRRERGRIHLVA